MAKWIRSPWNPRFMEQSPLLFHPLSVAATNFVRHDQWPDLDDYNALINLCDPVVRSEIGVPISFVEQDGPPASWQKEYEPRIFLDGEVQTRCENWHDFFQVLVWYSMPKTKSTLNALHFESIERRKADDPNNKTRSSIENALTQFDECGAIVTSSDPSLLDMIENFDWKTLFWEHRESTQQRLRCFCFGHAIYEKALNPYPGLTAHSILLPTAESFNRKPLQQQLKYLDAAISKKLATLEIQTPRDFAPFPLLGMPGWVSENQQESYYDNTDYFRPGRRS
ncbi:MAG: DUF3025 domain-containing protein [Gammaproteobacteria bacterium]|nr:DUF3025 domain-containing protein [Gammaproteobacteria bacterium]MDH5801691.1 DUF3025 domain-containing protein [Gammaproteobacteria bacterium]